MLSTKFKVDYAKDLCKCHNCNAAIPKYGIRFSRQAVYNPYIIHYYHINCLFKQFQLATMTTDLIDSAKDIDNFQNIDPADQLNINQLLKRM